MTLGQSSSNPNSPQKSSYPTAFQWPVPVTASCNDISLKEIIEKYYSSNNDLLKHVLIAKSEEDKKLAAHDVLKTEQARLFLRRMDIELLKEQSNLAPKQPPLYPVYPQQPQPYAFYSLAPVQQQVLARITSAQTPIDRHPPPHTSIPHSQHHQQQQQHNQQQQQQQQQKQSPKEYVHYNFPPPSPVVYPHSAHPLCPPDPRLNPLQRRPSHLLSALPSQQLAASKSPSHGNVNDNIKPRKRSHASIIYEEDKPPHNKVMEALKAKIQRGNGSPLATTAPNSALGPHVDKRRRTLPKLHTAEVPPILTHPHQLHHTPPPSTPSPRSAKPVLPPIDTNVGRLPAKNLPSHPPPLLSPMKTSSPPQAAISSIRSSHAYNNDSNLDNP